MTLDSYISECVKRPSVCIRRLIYWKVLFRDESSRRYIGIVDDRNACFLKVF